MRVRSFRPKRKGANSGVFSGKRTDAHTDRWTHELTDIRTHARTQEETKTKLDANDEQKKEMHSLMSTSTQARTDGRADARRCGRTNKHYTVAPCLTGGHLPPSNGRNVSLTLEKRLPIASVTSQSTGSDSRKKVLALPGSESLATFSS